MLFYCVGHAAMRLEGGNWVYNSDPTKFHRVMTNLVNQGANCRKIDCPRCILERKRDEGLGVPGKRSA